MLFDCMVHVARGRKGRRSRARADQPHRLRGQHTGEATAASVQRFPFAGGVDQQVGRHRQGSSGQSRARSMNGTELRPTIATRSRSLPKPASPRAYDPK